LTMASPIPLLLPVTSAFFPSNCKSMSDPSVYSFNEVQGKDDGKRCNYAL
jgi:hypothetical protein